MDNMVFGILTLAICTAGYFYSWKLQSQDKYKAAVFLLILCGLALRIYTSTDLFLHEWDERYHALAAKNLISHPLTPTLYDNPVLPYNYKSWAANHIWLHKQPLPLWTMALSMRIFGVNEIALRLPSILMTTAGIWLTFSIAVTLFNKKTGYIAAFLYSINGLIIELTGGRVATDHIDIFFLFFVELAVWLTIVFSQNRRMIFNVLAGASIGAAILCKWLPALIVLPVWLLIVADSRNFRQGQMIRHFIVLTLTCIVVCLPWQLYIFSTFPKEASWEAGFNVKHITGVLGGQTGPWHYFLDKIRINYGEAVYLPLIWFTWRTFKNAWDRKRLAIWIWFLVPLLFFSFARTKMQAYILFICPAIFIMTADFWHMLSVYREKHKPRWLYLLLMVLIIVLPIRYGIERTKPFERLDRNPQWAADLRNLQRRNIKNGVLLNYHRPIEAMFYTSLTAYSGIPSEEVIASLVEKGYKVIINDNGKVPGRIRDMEGVVFERINEGNDTER